MPVAGHPLIKEVFADAAAAKSPLSAAFYKALADGIDPGEVLSLSLDEFFATRLKIKDKRGRTMPFVLNNAQFHYLQNKTPRDIILKARQLGFSTMIQGYIYERVVRGRGVSGVTIANEGDNTAHLVEIFERFHANMPVSEQPFKKGRYPYGIKFPDRDGVVYIGTAGNRNWGRGKTVHFAHLSEVAFWPHPKTTMEGLLESVPPMDAAETYVVVETTANGAGGYFYEQVQKSLNGVGGWGLHFYPWWWAEEYKTPLQVGDSLHPTAEELEIVEYALRGGFVLTKEHLKWRRDKITELKDRFWQEYPETVQGAFLTSGRPRFEAKSLNRRLTTQAREPVYTELPVRYGEDGSGDTYYQLRIYEKAIRGVEYVIGADTAEGVVKTSDGDTDFSAAVVRNKRTNEQVATIHGRFEPFEFAVLLHDVGKYYNTALLGVERNNHGFAVLGYLIHGTADGSVSPYPNLYFFDDERPGWPTNVRTRPIMIDDLALDYASTQGYVIRDAAIINEAMTFTVGANGRAEASQGSFDDLVMADAIACEMRLAPVEAQQATYMPVRIGDF